MANEVRGDGCELGHGVQPPSIGEQPTEETRRRTRSGNQGDEIH